MKYYYAAYSHTRGMGGFSFSSKVGNNFSLAELKREIEKHHNSTENIVIISWQEITKTQYEAGLK